MADALYGDGGFFRDTAVPAAHFRTAAHVSPLWAQAVATVVQRAGGDTVVEVGAGGGELIGALAELLPDHHLTAVDLAPRPRDLVDRVEWRDSLPDAFEGALLAIEWLDNVPVDVVELADDGPHYIEVSTDGSERVGATVDTAAANWLGSWWPLAEVGDRAEVGITRDEAWAGAASRLLNGIALAVDYAADPRRDVAATLTGYRAGRQIAPVPDGSCDITAHVLMQSCAAAVHDVESLLITQQDALRALGVSAQRPTHDGDPQPYLAALQSMGEAAELLDPSGLGGFTWLLQARGVALPL
jgi:SAM-dependent MidA family methyltransferase